MRGEESADVVAATAFSPNDLPDGLVVADRRGRVVVINRAAERLTGVPAGAALGRDFRDVLPLRDDDGHDWWKTIDPYGGLRIRSRQVERLLQFPDGREVLVTAGFVREPERRGDVVRLAVCLRDASHRERHERSRADLVSTVAHELRSPLTSVKGFTATLLAKWSRFTDDQKRIMLETVNADADRVTRLITELLDVSRIESGRLEVRRQVVDVAATVSKVIAGRIAAGDPENRFRHEVRGGLPEMWLDPDKFEQIVANLIENAVRHGSGTVTIVVEPVSGHAGGVQAIEHAGGVQLTEHAGGVRAGGVESIEHAGGGHVADGAAVSVCDEGEGIAPETVPRVFRQFWRGKRRSGTGLGLFIVKGLVEAHGGTITVRRAPAGGAEFRFILPAGTPDFG